MEGYQMCVMSPAEAEISVRELKALGISKVGQNDWKDQRCSVEQLNMCAHTNANLKKDDFIRAYLIEHEKVIVLLHQLLTMEVWRHNVLPKVKEDIYSNPSAVYMYCYYEAIILNLLECIMYFEDAVFALGDDLLEFVDYLWRQVSSYCAEGGKIGSIEATVDPKVAQEDMKSHLERQLFQQQASRCMASISCLWFIIERINLLPMAVANNILLKNDLILGFSEVMVQQVWVRRAPKRVQKFVGGTFKDVPADDVMRICAPEAHAWFILHKLLCDRDCRKKYTYTSSKKEIILRIKRFLNETVVDQIPVLTDVQRALEELSFLEPPSGTEEKFKASLIIEQVPRIMAAIDNKDRNWAALANEAQKLLRDPGIRREDATRVARIFDAMFQFNDSESDSEAASAVSSGKRRSSGN